jgi:alanine racemase
VAGIYTHLYTTDGEISKLQRQRFLRAVRIAKGYFPTVLAHIGGTYAALLDESYAFDMVRVGIGLYGYLPADTFAKDFPLRKGMTVYAATSANRTYSYGGCGYGAASGRDMQKGDKISVCRFGYADGFFRKQENGADGGENANTLCMDVCLRKNGKRRGEWIPILTDAEKTAKIAGTIPYEVLCAVTHRAEYVYKYD